MNKPLPTNVALAVVVLWVSLSGGVHAEVPRKQPVGRYAELWTKSPFTVPPTKEAITPIENNPLEDYVLGGACAMENGWFVVLINKKKREERIRIKPNRKNDQGFKIVSVRQGAGYKDTKVEISTGGKKGWVEYDEKFLVLKKAVVSAPRGQPNGRPGDPRRAGERAGGPTPPRGGPPVPTPNRGSDRTSRVPSPPPQPVAAGGARGTTVNGGDSRRARSSSDRGGDRGRSRGRGR